MADRSSETTSAALVPILYAVVVVSLFVASFFPEYRIWGISHWAYFPLWVRLALLGLGILAGILILRWPFGHVGTADSGIATDRKRFMAVAVLLLGVYGLSFYVFRAQTHFLGDGYLLLGLLESGNLIVKLSNIGETIIHTSVFSLLPETMRERSLVTYQTLSIIAGLVLLICSVWGAMLIAKNIFFRLLLLLGLISSGYMLLFFGYVEHYSFFTVSVMLFCLIGIAVCKLRLNRWTILLPLAMAIWLHFFGIFLIPAAGYLLFLKTPFASYVIRTRRATRVLAVALTVVFALMALWYACSQSYYALFALVSPIATRFTVEGYTLFSLNHLADFANLVFLLLPGLPLMVAVSARRSVWKKLTEPWFRFLMIATVCCLGAVFMFDPKLGMPRDWDLFSFAGIPLTVMVYWLLLSGPDPHRHDLKAAALSVVLGLLVLVPRVAAGVVPEMAISHLRDYMQLDHTKSRAVTQVLGEYYESVHNIPAAYEEYDRYFREYPEESIGLQAKDLAMEGRFEEAVDLNEQAIRLNPMYSGGYANLGHCLNKLGHYDSALVVLRIADGLNPYQSAILSNLCFAMVQLRQYREAECYCRNAMLYDSTQLLPMVGITRVYLVQQRTVEYVRMLLRLMARPEPPLGSAVELVDYYLYTGDFSKALDIHRLHIQPAADSIYVRRIKATLRSLVETGEAD
ncbi:MAG: hypothetical protein KOO62_00560 [candidate division Zixibacteria bacterium]|nr:hypothetical protein [candidate division Zixibacteria bacterium]